MKRLFFISLLCYFFAQPTFASYAAYSRTKQNYDSKHFTELTRKKLKALSQVELLFLEEDQFGQEFFQLSLGRNLASFHFPSKSMNPFYDFESVQYLTKSGLERSQVFFHRGRLYQPNLTPYSSSVKLWKKKGEGDMIIMDHSGNLFIHPKNRGLVHHSSFFSALPAAYAGLVFVKNSYIKETFDYSGHYQPGPCERENFEKIKGNISEPILSQYKVMKKKGQNYLLLDGPSRLGKNLVRDEKKICFL